jgi:hypothetical protein
MKTTIDTLTGKPFRYNDTVNYMGQIVPARITSRTSAHLAPDRVPPRLLAKLNPPRQCAMCGAHDGLPHHDTTCGGVIVALAAHECLLPHNCWAHGALLCQPCREGSREIELEKSGTPEGLLAKAARLQTEFWEALSALEAELGCDVDGTQELEGMTVEDLRDGDKDEDEDEEEGK